MLLHTFPALQRLLPGLHSTNKGELPSGPVEPQDTENGLNPPLEGRR